MNCKKQKKKSDFAIKSGLKRHRTCKVCKRRYNKLWYKKNRTSHLKAVSIVSTLARTRLKDEVNKLKHNRKCTDCATPYPYYVMDFDHCRGKKKAHVADMVSRRASLQEILDEIKKCDLVCANCHRARTYFRSLQSKGARLGGLEPKTDRRLRRPLLYPSELQAQG